MKALVVDDEYMSRQLLIQLLKPYAECHSASNGIEAVEIFKNALEENKPFDLICLDIMLPEMDGHEVLRKVRQIEKEKNISYLNCVKIIMITALDDFDNIKQAFIDQCEAYIIKPIKKENFINQLKEFGIIK